jgi:hypothetical protein
VMTQKTFERVRRIELRLGVEPSHYEPGHGDGGGGSGGARGADTQRKAPAEERMRV